jgi:hypothetical protein
MVMGGYAVGFYEHPRLYELATGRVVEQWPELVTGKQSSSIIRVHDQLEEAVVAERAAAA